MFRDDLQICRVNARLTERLASFKGELWKAPPIGFGPTELALEHRESSPWSSGERALLRFTFALWNDSNPCDVSELFNLDCLADLGALLVAIAAGADAIDEWLEETADPDAPIPYSLTDKARAAVAGEARDG